MKNYDFFLFGLWVSADPATDFAALLDLGFCRILDAFDATLALVTSDFFALGIALVSFSYPVLLERNCHDKLSCSFSI